jgi:dihydroorotase
MTYSIIYNGTIVNDGKSYKGYLLFDKESGIIRSVRQGSPSPDIIAACAETFDADGCLVLPGAIDDQVHFRDPGLTQKGDIATESQAAAAGGVTSFMDMPNTKPATVTNEAMHGKLMRARDVSAVNYAFFIGATNDNFDVLSATDFTRCPGVKLFLGSSTGNMLVDNEKALNKIFANVPAIIAVHSEDEATIKANRDRISAEHPEGVAVELHPAIRSREACIISTTRAMKRAQKYGSRLHVLHVSTAEEAEMFSNRPLAEKRITAEVSVHHLWFCADDYARLGTRIKMNPAIKSATDRDALRKALRDGRIDIVATDHAPHLPADKEGDALTAASGAPMVQFSLPLMLEMADMGIFTRELVVEKMCHAPAKLFGIRKRGYLRKGYAADIAVVRVNAPYTVTDDMALSRCGWTPLAGTTLHNRVVATWVNGNAVWRDGAINPDVRGTALKFDKS